MKKLFLLMLALCGLLCLTSCNKSGLNDEMAQMLEKRYGKPVVVELKKTGSFGSELRKTAGEEKINYLRISGPMNGADIDSLKKISWDLRVLDLLDASIVAGVPYHDYREEKTISTDNIIGDDMFNYMNLEQLILPSGITRIEDEAFYGCNNLENIYIPTNVISIGCRAFSSCSSLTSLQLPFGLQSIGESAFYGCSSLKKLRIPQSVSSLIIGSFCEVTDLYLEWTPEKLEKLGELDFKWLWMNDNPPPGVRAHFVTRSPTLHVPANFVDAYKGKFPNYTVLVDDGDREEAYKPTFIIKKGHVGPVKVGLIADVPVLVDGLYDNFEKKSDDSGKDYLHFMKDGKMVFKAELDGDNITSFIIYPDAKNVSTVLGIHVGDHVSNISLQDKLLKWSRVDAETLSCSDYTFIYYVSVQSLKSGINFPQSLNDFEDNAVINIIKVK